MLVEITVGSLRVAKQNQLCNINYENVKMVELDKIQVSSKKKKKREKIQVKALIKFNNTTELDGCWNIQQKNWT